MFRLLQFLEKMEKLIDSYSGLVHCCMLLTVRSDNRPRLYILSSTYPVRSSDFLSNLAARSRGSPAYQFGLMNTMYITHLNGVPTPGMCY